MRLRPDPPVGCGEGRPPRSRLTYKDLQYRSPYNTYLQSGLPPGPICNPGRSSIEAALNPTEGIQDLYFVARGGGRHLFSRTYNEHLRNIRLVRAPSNPAPNPDSPMRTAAELPVVSRVRDAS